MWDSVLVDSVDWREILPVALKKQVAMLWEVRQESHKVRNYGGLEELTAAPDGQQENKDITPTIVKKWILPTTTWDWKKIPSSRRECSPANT